MREGTGQAGGLMFLGERGVLGTEAVGLLGTAAVGVLGTEVVGVLGTEAVGVRGDEGPKCGDTEPFIRFVLGVKELGGDGSLEAGLEG